MANDWQATSKGVAAADNHASHQYSANDWQYISKLHVSLEQQIVWRVRIIDLKIGVGNMGHLKSKIDEQVMNRDCSSFICASTERRPKCIEFTVAITVANAVLKIAVLHCRYFEI